MFRSRLCAVGVFLAAAAPVLGVPWIATSYFEQEIITIASKEVIGGVTFSADLFTRTAAISITKSPQPTPMTVMTSYLSAEDVTWVDEVFSAGAGKTIDLLDNLNQAVTLYYVNISWTAPASCPAPRWTYTSSVVVDVPEGVSPTPISTLPVTVPLPGAGETNYMIDPSNINSVSLAHLKSSWNPAFVSSCQEPVYATATGVLGTPGPSSTNGEGFSDCVPFELFFAGSAVGGGYECDDGTHWTWGLSLAGLICAWIFSFLGFFLICGLIENFVSFRSLSRGKAARRGIPICFAFMFPMLSCFFLLGANRGFMAKPFEEQQRLQQRWNDLGSGTRISQWLSWGFRWGYPPFLGPEPPHKGSHYHPSTTYYAGAPGQPQPPVGQMGQQPYQSQHNSQPPMSPYHGQAMMSPYNNHAPMSPYQQPGSPQYYDARSPGAGSQPTSPPPAAHAAYGLPPHYDTSKGSPVQEHTSSVSPMRSMPTSPNGPAAALAPGQPTPTNPPHQGGHPGTQGPAELQ